MAVSMYEVVSDGDMATLPAILERPDRHWVGGRSVTAGSIVAVTPVPVITHVRVADSPFLITVGLTLNSSTTGGC